MSRLRFKGIAAAAFFSLGIASEASAAPVTYAMTILDDAVEANR
jgi:hypothetical protein